MSQGKEAKNCWEFKECPPEKRSKCSAYKVGAGQECWLVCEYAKLSSRDFCLNCEWFKQFNA